MGGRTSWVWRIAAGLAVITANAAGAVPINGNLPAWVSTQWGQADVNRCAVDPIGDLENAIDADPGYIMAYRSGRDTCSVFSPVANWPRVPYGEMNHRQSIQRIYAQNKSYLLVSASLSSYSTGLTAGFDIVEMGSRKGATCALGSGGVNSSVRANCGDHVAAFLGIGETVHEHAGGMQAMGRFVSVAYEDNSGSTASDAVFRIADLTDPLRPFWGNAVSRQRGHTRKMASTCLTKLLDGTYMLLAFGRDSDDVEVFISNSTVLTPAVTSWTSMNSRQLAPIYQPKVGLIDGLDLWKPYQNVQCVTGCDGKLYALATHSNDFVGGLDTEDWADLWQVTLDFSTYYPSFSKVANRHMYCNDDYCRFDAGAGAYVDPNGRLAIYGVEYYDTHYPGDGSGVKMQEFATPAAASCVASTCMEGSCFNSDGAPYWSHYSGPNCTGTEYYYTPYFANGFKCRPWDTNNARCGAARYNVSVRSVRDANGNCTTPWQNGNPLTNFAEVYRVACGESGCFRPDGTPYFSHFEGPNCSGTEYYFTPYFSAGYKCRPSGTDFAICGQQQRTATVRSVRDANGVCTTPWQNGNNLYGLAKVYR